MSDPLPSRACSDFTNIYTIPLSPSPSSVTQTTIHGSTCVHRAATVLFLLFFSPSLLQQSNYYIALIVPGVQHNFHTAPIYQEAKHPVESRPWVTLEPSLQHWSLPTSIVLSPPHSLSKTRTETCESPGLSSCPASGLLRINTECPTSLPASTLLPPYQLPPRNESEPAYIQWLHF